MGVAVPVSWGLAEEVVHSHRSRAHTTWIRIMTSQNAEEVSTSHKVNPAFGRKIP